MAKPELDIVSGRSALAWRRGCECRTAWLSQFSAATLWLKQPVSLNLADWNASPFGVRLAEVTLGFMGDYSSATLEQAPQPRPAPSAQDPGVVLKHRRENMHAIGAFPGKTSAGVMDGYASAALEQAQQPRPTPSGKDTGVVLKRRKENMHAIGAFPGETSAPAALAANMAHSRLATLAGVLPRNRYFAEQSLPSSHQILQPYANAGNDKARRLLTNNAVGASDSLIERMSARLNRVFSRVYWHTPSKIGSVLTSSDSMGWERTITEHESDLVISLPGMRRLQQQRKEGRWPIAQPKPDLGLFQPGSQDLQPPVGRSVANALRSRAVPQSRFAAPFEAAVTAELPSAMDTSPILTKVGRNGLVNIGQEQKSKQIKSSSGAEMFPSLKILQCRDGLSSPSDESNMTSKMRSHLDPVEFAEYLRAALVDDARRHGIEV